MGMRILFQVDNILTGIFHIKQSHIEQTLEYSAAV